MPSNGSNKKLAEALEEYKEAVLKKKNEIKLFIRNR